jgi:hypothetical protein
MSQSIRKMAATVVRSCRHIAWGPVLLRLACVVLYACTVRIYCEKAVTRYENESLYGGFHNSSQRVRRLFTHVDTINRGHYLKSDIHPTKSFIRNDGNDDPGVHLGLANLALVRGLFVRGAGTLEHSDVFRVQYYVVLLALIVCFLPVVPLPYGLAAGTTLALMQIAGVMEWSAFCWWPPSVAVVLAYLLLLGVVRTACTGGRPGRAALLQWLVVAAVAGLTRYLRADCRYFVALPLVGLFAANAVMLVASCLPPGRVAAGTRPAGRIARLKQVFAARPVHARMLCATAVALLAVKILAPLLFHLNIMVFEGIEGLNHTPMKQGHAAWHNVYIGVGATLNASDRSLQSFNHENIVWHDPCGFNATRQAYPSIPVLTDAYQAAVGRMWFALLKNNPRDVLDSCLVKGTHLLYQARYFAALGIAAAFALCALAYRRRTMLVLTSNYMIGCVALLGTSVLPPVLCAVSADGSLGLDLTGFPFMYAIGFVTCLLGLPLFCLALAVAEDWREGVEQDGYASSLRTLLTVAFLGGGLVVALFLGTVGRQSRRVALLSSQMAVGKKSIEELTKAYHADAVRAFNRLGPRRRQMLASQAVTTDGSQVGCAVQLHGEPSLKLLQVRWANGRIFALIESAQPLYGVNVPSHIQLDTDPPVPPNERRVNFMWLLPSRLAPGVWLFSFAATERAKEVVLGQAKRVSPQSYNSPMSAPMYTIRPKR